MGAGKEMDKWILMTTARAPTNIAVIKYWGKRDETLILPLNENISVTLDLDHLSATTTVAVSPSFQLDRMWLNGKALILFDTSTSIVFLLISRLISSFWMVWCRRFLFLEGGFRLACGRSVAVVRILRMRRRAYALKKKIGRPCMYILLRLIISQLLLVWPLLLQGLPVLVMYSQRFVFYPMPISLVEFF